MTEEFDGEDVLHPRVRVHFDDAMAGLMALHGKLQRYTASSSRRSPTQT